MKTHFNLKEMSSRAKVSVMALVLLTVLSSFGGGQKVTICHVPPGNPANCHEITISVNALQAHLDHGDRLYCRDAADYEGLLKLTDGDASKIIKEY